MREYIIVCNICGDKIESTYDMSDIDYILMDEESHICKECAEALNETIGKIRMKGTE